MSHSPYHRLSNRFGGEGPRWPSRPARSGIRYGHPRDRGYPAYRHKAPADAPTEAYSAYAAGSVRGGQRSRLALIRQTGFTLLEMLVAMVILAMVITTVYSAFHVGVLAARRGMREETSFRHLSRLNLMAAEIRNAVYWNNTVITGTGDQLSFFVPMMLKDPKDLFPLYRVRYWREKSAEGNSTLHRSVVPWILLQKPGMRPEDIASLEKSQEWLGPLEDFKIQYALNKKRASLANPQVADSLESDEMAVEGAPDLIWKTSLESPSQIPYGIRMQWKQPTPEDESAKFSVVFWPALGLHQTKPANTNVAPNVSVISVSGQRR